MGQPLSTSTYVTYSPTGICTTGSWQSATTCSGVWTASTFTCSEWKPTLTSAACTAPGTWKAVAGQTQPPFTIVATTPAPTADPACACTTGQACASSTCNSCVVNKVCTKVFPTKDECLTLTTNGKWCGN